MENLVNPISEPPSKIRRTSLNQQADSLPELNIECRSD